MKKMISKKGFTLIELMAVIAIIAILAAVLVPTVTGYINRSKKTAVITQIRNAVNAVETYNATSSKAIETKTKVTTKSNTDSTITSITDETTSIKSLAELVGTDILSLDGINKLGNLQIGTALLINKDPNAINNISIKTNGEFESYLENIYKPTSQQTTPKFEGDITYN